MTDAAGKRPIPESTVVADSQPGSPSRARRRLILAAGAALPSIYTLGSGAQTAVGSHMVCLAKQGSAPPPIRFTQYTGLGLQDNDHLQTPEGWLRAPVNFGEYDGSPADCVTTPQASCVAFTPSAPANSSPMPSAGPGPGTNAENGSVWIVQGNRMTSNANTPITHVNLAKKHYGLVYVDETGSVATLDPNGALGLHPTTNSCWASIMGGRISKLG
jgi:hypothetical protein